jgi:hypothetical protein
MERHLRIYLFTLVFSSAAFPSTQAQTTLDPATDSPATIILFRTFDVFSFDRSFKLYARDSLLGRIKTKEVIIFTTNEKEMTFHATTRAPSLNSDKRANHKKIKTIRYTLTLQGGQTYYVKCGYLTQNLFDLPRQPTIRLLKPDEVKKYTEKRFLRKKIKPCSPAN